MNIDPASLILGIIASAIGSGYFLYGKKRSQYIPLGSGIALCIVPFLFDTLGVQIAICSVLAVLPWVWKE
jgi:hypothetical protein